MGTYRAVIAIEKVDSNNVGTGEYDYYEADVMDPLQVALRSDVSAHPLVEGNTLADHMITQPTSLTLTGKFSLTGTHFTEFEGPKERLANVEDTFERALKEGRFCKVMTIGKEDAGSRNGKIRFVQRDKLVINDIRWTEHLNSLDFTFGFTEVLTAQVLTVEYVKDVRDPNLPDLTEPVTLDFTDEYIDFKWLEGFLLQLAEQKGLISKQAAQAIATTGKVASWVGTGAAVGGAITIGASLAAIGTAITAGTSWTGVGLAIGAGLLVVGGLIYLIGKLTETAGNQELHEAEEAEAAQQDIDEVRVLKDTQKFNNWKSETFKAIDELEKTITLYGITSNTAQECLLQIDNEYYTFIFSKSAGGWSLRVVTIDDEEVASQGVLTGLSSISECTTSNRLFRTSSGKWVYLMCPIVSLMKENGRSQTELNEAKRDLTNYHILISENDLNKFNQKLETIIRDAWKA